MTIFYKQDNNYNEVKSVLVTNDEGKLTEPSVVFSQHDGEWKETYNTLSKASIWNNIDTSTSIVYDIVESDTHLFVMGSFFNVFGDDTIWALIPVVKETGELDEVMMANLSGGPDGNVRCGRMQADGKLIIGGSFDYIGTTACPRLVRLNSDMTIDSTFLTNIGTGLTSNNIYDVEVDGDGNIYAVGDFTVFNGNTRNRMVKLDSTGTEDTTFATNIGTGFGGSVLCCTIGDGIMVGGSFTTFNSNTRGRIVKLATSGVEDATFVAGVASTGNGTGFSSTVNCICYVGDGYAVGGNFSGYCGTNYGFFFMIDTDGTYDDDFINMRANGGYANPLSPTRYTWYTSQVRCINYTNGYLTVGGSFLIYLTDKSIIWNRCVVLSAERGTLDIGGGKTIYLRGKPVDEQFPETICDSDPYCFSTKKVGSGSGAASYIGGQFQSIGGKYLGKVAEIGYTNGGVVFAPYANGSFTNVFKKNINVKNKTLTYNGNVKAAAKVGDEVFFGGITYNYDDTFFGSLIKVDKNYRADTTFASNSGRGFTSTSFTAYNDVVNDFVIKDNEIVAVGNFTAYNDTSSTRIIRLNLDGTVAGSFVGGIGNEVNGIKYLPVNNKYVIWGIFTTVFGTTARYLSLLNTDFTLDTTFNTNIGTASSTINGVFEHPDGRLFVTGTFTTFNGVAGTNRLVVLNSNGTIDSSYMTALGTGFNSTVNSVAFTSSGDAIIVGNFTTYQTSLTRNRIIKLSSTGVEDTTFYTNLGTALGAYGQNIHKLDTGVYVIFGAFTTLNGNIRTRVAFINDSGIEETDYYTRLYSMDSANTDISSLGDGKYLLFGSFKSINGLNKPYISEITLH